jgi:histone H3/H4
VLARSIDIHVHVLASLDWRWQVSKPESFGCVVTKALKTGSVKVTFEDGDKGTFDAADVKAVAAKGKVEAKPVKKAAKADTKKVEAKPAKTDKAKAKKSKREFVVKYRWRTPHAPRADKKAGGKMKGPRARPGQRALREIRLMQKVVGLVMPRLPFARLVRDLMVKTDKDSGGGLGVCRMQQTAREALQDAVEMYMVHLLEMTNRAAIHRNRVTIFPQDLRFVGNLMRTIQGHAPVPSPA